jgi:peptidoglycan hydrolase CwlO-like protein
VNLRRVALLIILVLSSLTVAVAQNPSVESLRSQLSDVQKKEEELQARLRQIDEDMRPENIERFFALNGSTRPEELREQRRRQLENQRATVQTQLDQLAQSRVRLETSLATAEAAAYRQSALPPDSYNPTPAVISNSPTAKPKKSQRRARRRQTRRASRRG